MGLILEARGRNPAHVVALSPDGPAEKCGKIKLGDVLTSVDGRSVSGSMTPNEIATLISGPEGTQVRISWLWRVLLSPWLVVWRVTPECCCV